MSPWHAGIVGIVAAATLFGGGYFVNALMVGPTEYLSAERMAEQHATSSPEVVDERGTTSVAVPTWPAALAVDEYNERLLALAHYTPPQPIHTTTTVPVRVGTTTVMRELATTTMPASPLRYSSSTNVSVAGKWWPKAQAYPNGDALLPFYRILAYYGNFYSTRMGVLGEFDEATVLQKLADTQKLWEAADPTTPVMPAIQYIAMVAQADGGRDGMYRAVMPDKEIDRAYEMAHKAGGVLFLDLQVGLSTIERELPQFTKYLMRPDVHLAIDPEFSMKTGAKPGTVIGTFDASDINYVIQFLSQIVRTNELPPKVLVVHRFTQDMVTNADAIKATPEVQVVIDMDGWGSKDLKRGSYNHVILQEPVQFAGIKIFYYNDLKPPSTGLLTPAEVLRLNPKPIYIQYQ